MQINSFACDDSCVTLLFIVVKTEYDSWSDEPSQISAAAY